MLRLVVLFAYKGRSQRAPQASVVSTSKYGRISASDVKSPSLLLLLLLLTVDAAVAAIASI